MPDAGLVGRRAYRPLVDQYVALSFDLTSYLRQRVGVPERRVVQIYNGVDIQRFRPDGDGRAPLPGCPYSDPALFVVGTVGRMQTVKAQALLASAFVHALELQPALRSRLRLVMVGDGPLRAEAKALLDAAKAADLAWLPGERADVPDVMRGLDCFVLPSLAEGISNTILEDMATGLPVLVTQVGGNAELVVEGETGVTVPSGDVEATSRRRPRPWWLLPVIQAEPWRWGRLGGRDLSGSSVCRPWWVPIRACTTVC